MTSNDPSDADNETFDRRAMEPQSAEGASISSHPATTGRSGSGGSMVRLAPGALLSDARYKIEKLLAAGGMGAVYRAIDTRFNRPCAVKEMLDNFRSDAERVQLLEWFEREATLLLDLNHPCIPRVRDFFAAGGKHYLVMDLIDGRTLAQVVEQEGNVMGVNGAHGVSEARVRSWALQICSVLDYLHSQNPPIIFRDLKPLNIMVTNDEKIKLIDFGIARSFQVQAQATVIMTIGYAPPEQLAGRPEPRSDLYALGATLHKVLTCHDAMKNSPSIFNFPPLRTLRPDITPAFEQVVMKALNSVIEQRWSDAAEIERALINLPLLTAVPPSTRSGSMLSGGQQGQNPVTNRQSSRMNTTGQPATSSTAGSSIPGSGSGASSTMPLTTTYTTGPASVHIRTALKYLTATPVRVEEAFEAVKIAQGLEPNNPLVYRLFGLAYTRRVPPQTDLALNAYSRSLQLNPNDAETYKLVGDVSLYLREQPLQAIPHYIQSLRLNGNDYVTHWRLGQCYEKTNQLESAMGEYQESARLAPKQSSALKLHATLGQLALRLNQLLIAEHAFVQVLTLNAGDYQTRFLLSQVYERQGKFERALRECGYVLQSPLQTDPAAQQMYQRLRMRLGR